MIKPVERFSNLAEVGCQAVRFKGQGATLNHIRKLQQCLEKVDFLLLLNQFKACCLQEPLDVIDICPFLRRKPQDAGDASMGVLQIIDRVLLRLLLCQGNIKIEMSIRAAHDEKIVDSVCPHLVDQLIQGIDLGATLGHFHDFILVDKGNHLMDDHFYRAGVISQSLHSGKNVGDSRNVIRAKNVDDQLESASKFLAMICDVRQPVGRLACPFHNNTVLIQAQCGSFEPDSTVLVIREATRAELL